MAMPADGDKDTRFFSYFYDRGFAWYQRQFPDDVSGKMVGEMSTSYFPSVEAPARVHAYAPDVKLIVCLRHPVERAFSNHKHEISVGRIEGENRVFENALAQNPMYLEQSRYYTHLSRWLEYFSRENVLVLLVEDIRADARGSVKKIYEFLGVDSQFQPSNLRRKVHETQVMTSTGSSGLLKNIAGLMRGLGLSRFIRFLRNRGLQSAATRRISDSGSDVFPPMREETKSRLLQYFENENQLLAELLGRDLSSWSVYPDGPEKSTR